MSYFVWFADSPRPRLLAELEPESFVIPAKQQPVRPFFFEANTLVYLW